MARHPASHGRIACMAFNPLTYIFGSRNDRLLKTYRKTLERINALEVPLESLSDEQLKVSKTLLHKYLKARSLAISTK
jgi:preprotein translocase subunit SecA